MKMDNLKRKDVHIDENKLFIQSFDYYLKKVHYKFPQDTLILNFGCGPFREAYELKNYLRGKGKVIGFDNSASMLSDAKYNIKNLHNFEIYNIDAKDAYRVIDKQADLIIIRHPQTEHDWKTVLLSTKRVLKDEGLIYMTNYDSHEFDFMSNLLQKTGYELLHSGINNFTNNIDNAYNSDQIVRDGFVIIARKRKSLLNKLFR